MVPSTDSLAATFTSASRAAGGNLRRVGSGCEVAEILEQAVTKHSAPHTLLYEPCELAEELGLPLALSARGIRLLPVSASGDRAPGLTIGLTGASIGIAATGTILVGGRPGGWGLASVLPWIHFALIRERDVYPDLASAFAVFHARFAAGDRDWVWITGPSKTADIAKTLVMGIHGPNALEILLVHESAVRGAP